MKYTLSFKKYSFTNGYLRTRYVISLSREINDMVIWSSFYDDNTIKKIHNKVKESIPSATFNHNNSNEIELFINQPEDNAYFELWSRAGPEIEL